jgi:hypothetical protein
MLEDSACLRYIVDGSGVASSIYVTTLDRKKVRTGMVGGPSGE